MRLRLVRHEDADRLRFMRHPPRLFPMLLLPVLAGLSACAHSTPDPSPVLESQLEEIRDLQRPLHSKEDFSAAEQAYLAHYGLRQAPAVDHHFGFLDCRGTKVAAHWCQPPAAQRLVVVAHGYYDHCGTWKHAIPALLADGNAVFIYDHPGHGLSEGERASIEDFRDYAVVLDEVVTFCQGRSELPIVLAGHSMGCAVITEFLLGHHRHFEPARTVFLSPLVRPTSWNAARVGHAALDWLVAAVPRVPTENSSDPVYLEFVRHDPLHHRSVPLAWTGALFAWNERAETFVPDGAGRPVTILQGVKDKTVSWEFNLDFLSARFPNHAVRMFPEGRHQLLNEAEPLRSEVLGELADAVAGN
jgi:alpha-beta hydrolase superfamily lysophospholipase